MMQVKTGKTQIVTLALCAAMLLAVLLEPLVQVMSYRWGLAELPHKIGRLVDSAAVQGVAFVLLALMVLAPMALAVATVLKGRAGKVLRCTPAAASLLLLLPLIAGRHAAPAAGLWAYVLLAVATIAADYILHRKNSF